MKHTKPLNTRNNKNKRHNNTRFKGGDAQMFILMGVLLAISVVIVAIINSNIANTGSTITQSHSKSIAIEFDNVEEKFGLALKYSIDKSQDLESEFNRIADKFYRLEIQTGYYFDAEYIQHWYTANDYVINSKITLTDGDDLISKNLNYFVTLAV